MKKAFFRLCILIGLLPPNVEAQLPSDLVPGPMLGQVDDRTARIWVEAKAGKLPLLRSWKKDDPKLSRIVKGDALPQAVKQGFGVILYPLHNKKNSFRSIS